MARPSRHAHKLVHATAVQMAHAQFEALMHDNDWFALWKKLNPGIESTKGLEARFVAGAIGKLLGPARAQMAKMLALPGLDEMVKRQIYEALVLDNTLIRGR